MDEIEVRALSVVELNNLLDDAEKVRRAAKAIAGAYQDLYAAAHVVVDGMWRESDHVLHACGHEAFDALVAQLDVSGGLTRAAFEVVSGQPRESDHV